MIVTNFTDSRMYDYLISGYESEDSSANEVGVDSAGINLHN